MDYTTTTVKRAGITYNVSKEDDSAEAIMILEKLNIFVIDVIRELKRALYANIVPEDKRYFVINLVNKYNPTRINEGLPNGEDTSFVIDKGEKLVMCLRDRNMRFHELSVLQFVILHEISHIGSIEHDHNTEFWGNFRWLLRFTAANKLYMPVDYSKEPVEYCRNIQLNDNPYFDLL